MTEIKAVEPGSARMPDLSSFQNFIEISFRDAMLLDSALTHRSFVNEKKGARLTDNERLEFLGDAVLGHVVASHLFASMPQSPEGELARIKSIVVSESTLAVAASEIGIPKLLRLGKGEELSGGRQKRAILADALEAVIGAVFIDQGYDASVRFVIRVLGPQIKMAMEGLTKDFKTIIQEYAQRYSQDLPHYELDKTEGPEHDRRFWVTCSLGPRKFGPYSGKTKKEAEQSAAEQIFKTLRKESILLASRLDVIASG